MSYTRSYRERIAVHYSGTVRYSYPASQNGGSGTAHYSGTEYEDINVNIEVDTDNFDASVNDCNNSVNYLTGSIVATEAAQIASINKNAKQVGNTIVEGFFKTIRSEIGQQLTELTQKIDAHLMHLRELAKSCSGKQKQMEVDYNRISDRYLKIFEDLNNELSNRIYELNKPAFVFKKTIEDQKIRSSSNDLISTVSVFGLEVGELQSKISASIAKKRAFETILKSKIFLYKQKKLETTLNQCILNENISNIKYIPICFFETQNKKDQIERNIFKSNYLPSTNYDKLVDDFKNQNWKDIPVKEKVSLKNHLNSEISKAYSINNQHNNRVIEMIYKIFDMNKLKSI